MCSSRLLSAIVALTFSGPLSAEPLRADAKNDVDKLPDQSVARLGTSHFRHGAPVSAMAVAPNGLLIASASRDNTVRVFEAESGKLVHEVRCEQPYPTCVAFSPDGTQIALPIDGDNIAIETLDHSKDRRVIPCPLTQTLAYTRDGKHLAMSSVDAATVMLLDVATGKPQFRYDKAARIALSADDERFAVAQHGGTIKIHKRASGEVLSELPAVQDAGDFDDLFFASKGDHLIAVHEMAGSVIWDLKQKETLFKYAMPGPWIQLPGQNSLAFIGKDSVCFFDWNTGQKKISVVKAQANAPLACFPDGNRLAVGGPGNRIHVWNLTTGQDVTVRDGHTGEVTHLAYSKDGKHLFSLSKDSLRLWDATTFQERATARRTGPIHALALTADGNRLLLGGPKNVGIWTPITIGKEPPYPEKASLTIPTLVEVSLLATAPDGQRILFNQTSHKLTFADPVRGTTSTGLEFSSEASAIALAPNNRCVAVVTRDGFLRHWQIGISEGDGGKSSSFELWARRVQRGIRGSVAFSPDGLLIAAYSGGRVCLFDAATGRQWYGFERKFGEGDVHAVAFSADGCFIAAAHGGGEGFVRVWEISTGKAFATFMGHVGPVYALAIAPDGKQLASAGAEGTILVWDLHLPGTKEAAPIQMAEAWDRLDSLDGPIALNALMGMRRHGREAIPFIQNSLNTAGTNQKRLGDLIGQLDDDDFKVRKVARAAIDKEGYRALPIINEALKRKLPIETERQLRIILEDLEARGIVLPDSGLYGETLRVARSIQILESIGGPDAIKVLEPLVKSPNERLAAEALGAIERLKR